MRERVGNAVSGVKNMLAKTAKTSAANPRRQRTGNMSRQTKSAHRYHLHFQANAKSSQEKATCTSAQELIRKIHTIFASGTVMLERQRSQSAESTPRPTMMKESASAEATADVLKIPLMKQNAGMCMCITRPSN
mmetsp:Transcript_54247/g.144907  ORF Transcript_54247/g.144907 Transcript_54247/m.144907 type:complete len:134 (+) Transcript_54247:294-695(+)